LRRNEDAMKNQCLYSKILFDPKRIPDIQNPKSHIRNQQMD